MLNIFSRLSQLDEVDKFKQWAMRVVENEAKMHRRKRRQHLYESLDAANAEGAEEKPFRPRQFADWRARLILFGESSLRRALQQYLVHYHEERNHQGRDNRILFPSRLETREDGSSAVPRTTRGPAEVLREGSGPEMVSR